MGGFRSKHALNKEGEEARGKDGVEFKGMKKVGEGGSQGNVSRSSSRSTLTRRQRFNKAVHESMPWVSCGKGGSQSNGVEEEMIQGQATGNLHAARPGGGGTGVLNVETAVQPIDDCQTTDDESVPPGIGVVKAGGVVEPQTVGEPRVLKHETQQEKVIQSKEEVLQNGAVLETTTEIVTKKRILHIEQDVINGDDHIRESRKEVITMETSQGGTPEAAALILEMEKAKYADTVESEITEDHIIKTEAKKPVEAHNPMLETFKPRPEDEIKQERIAKIEAKAEQSAPPAEPVPAAVLEPEEEGPEIEEDVIQATEAKKPEEADPVKKLEAKMAEAEQPVVQAEPPIVQAEQPVVQAEPPIVEAEQQVVHAEPPIVQAEQQVVHAELPAVGDDDIIVPQQAKRPDQPEAALLAEFREKTEEEKEQDRLALEKAMDAFNIADTPAPAVTADIQVEEEEDLPEIVEDEIQKAEAKKPEESAPEMPVLPAPLVEPIESQQTVAQEEMPPPVEAEKPTEDEVAPEDVQLQESAPVEALVEETPAPLEEKAPEEAAPAPAEELPPVPPEPTFTEDLPPPPMEAAPIEEQTSAPEVPVEVPVEEQPPPPPCEEPPSQEESSVPSEPPMEQQAAPVEEQAPVSQEAEAKTETEEQKPAEAEVTPQEAAPVEQTPEQQASKDDVVEKAESEGKEKASDEPSEAEVAEAVDAVAAAVMEEAVTEAAEELNKDSQPAEQCQDDTPIASDVPEDSSTDSIPVPPTAQEPPSIPKTEIEWEYGGNHVVVLGSFDGWENEIELQNHDGVFKAQLDLPEGRYEYKFKVDGEWALSKSKENDGDNNVLIVPSS